MLIPQAIVQQGSSFTPPDPVQDVLGTPTVQYDAAGILGLTQLGSSPTTENADSTVPDNYYIALNAAAGVNWKGRYTTFTVPFTAITYVTAFAGFGTFQAAALFIAEAAPGAMHTFGPRATSDRIANMQLVSWTGPTGTGSDLGAYLAPLGYTPMWLALKVNSSDDVDSYFSANGYVWTRFVNDTNPTYTVGSVGVAVNVESASQGVAAAFPWLRIWDSALTLPGSG